MTNSEKETLIASGMVIENCRHIWNEQSKLLFKTAAKIVSGIFSSQADIQGIMEAELLYMQNERKHCHSDHVKMLDNTITAYRNALNILKIITDEPEMYVKYCAPACVIMQRKNKRGIPHDAFHYVLALHNMRFQNELTSPYLTDEDYEIFVLRLKNLNTAWRLYIELQKKVMKIIC